MAIKFKQEPNPWPVPGAAKGLYARAQHSQAQLTVVGTSRKIFIQLHWPSVILRSRKNVAAGAGSGEGDSRVTPVGED